MVITREWNSLPEDKKKQFMAAFMADLRKSLKAQGLDLVMAPSPSNDGEWFIRDSRPPFQSPRPSAQGPQWKALPEGEYERTVEARKTYEANLKRAALEKGYAEARQMNSNPGRAVDQPAIATAWELDKAERAAKIAALSEQEQIAHRAMQLIIEQVLFGIAGKLLGQIGKGVSRGPGASPRPPISPNAATAEVLKAKAEVAQMLPKGSAIANAGGQIGQAAAGANRLRETLAQEARMTPNPPGGPGTPAPTWKLGSNHSATQWANKMTQRGWTPEQISEAIANGQRFPAANNVNPGNAATRYVHPTTGRSVIVDNVTKEVIHVGGDGFLY